MTPEETIKNINDVISKVIEAGISDQQNYPRLTYVGQNECEIGISGSPDMSISLRDIPYPEIYDGLDAAKAYHMKLIDGAIVQMVYSFHNGNIKSHRLAVFPAPYLMNYANAAASYEEDQIYAEVVGTFSVRVPLRFDYSSDDREFIDVEHPRSHLTLGQYKGCRIPVSGPLTPARFMRFVLRNFYNPAYGRFDLDSFALRGQFPESISVNERRIAHFIG